jgi:cytidylate kinase
VDKVIAIDGPGGAGKSSVAKGVAQELVWIYLDTGSMYRAVALAWLRAGRDEALLSDVAWLRSQELVFAFGRLRLNGTDVSQEIRTAEVTRLASWVSARKDVREFLTFLQRKIGAEQPCVLEGRDIGTVVFPGAFFKVYLIASLDERAQRRWLQLGGTSCATTLDDIRVDIETRDLNDSQRQLAPLKPAADAWHLDTDDLTEQDVVHAIVAEASKRLKDWNRHS